MKTCFVSALGGVPMINDSVNASTLATLACAVRRRLDSNKQPLADYLQPELAIDSYRNAKIQPSLLPDSVAPNAGEMKIIQAICDDVVSIVPEWRAHFSIPIRWRVMSECASLSNRLLPQTIFLGREALQSPRLAEHIVHEVSHTWVGMIGEVAPLATGYDPVYTLPSGTMNKTTGQVIYALTFAVTAIRYYRERAAAGMIDSIEKSRLVWLESYSKGCLQLLESSKNLLPNGAFIADSCRAFLHT